MMRRVKEVAGNSSNREFIERFGLWFSRDSWQIGFCCTPRGCILSGRVPQGVEMNTPSNEHGGGSEGAEDPTVGADTVEEQGGGNNEPEAGARDTLVGRNSHQVGLIPIILSSDSFDKVNRGQALSGR